MALKTDGTVWAWGSNISGELGDGTFVEKLKPVMVPGLSGIKDIAAGNNFSIALKNNGTVWVWGNSNYGIDSEEAYKNRSKPVEVKELNSIRSISAGKDHGLAFKADRTVWTWGSNGYGQFGRELTASEQNKKKALKVSGLSDLINADAGNTYNLAIRSKGTIVGWGNNDFGQLGVKRNDKAKNTVYDKLSINDFSPVTQLSAGENHSLALKKDGTLWAWGDNSYGQLGLGDTVSRYVPELVSSMSDIKHIDAGTYYTVAVKNDGTIWVWGDNKYGQLGIGSPEKELNEIPQKAIFP